MEKIFDVENGFIMCADVLDALKELDNNSVDSIVTDPPYGISFMNKKWDYDVPKIEVWQEIYRILKPGGYLLAACGTRTQHRMVVNIEDGGFEIRDVITWHYGSGFPKSMDISKALVKSLGVERETLSIQKRDGRKSGILGKKVKIERKINEAASEDAKKWDGWGTALKPATEFWTLARKPLSEKTVAANVLKWGTGGINIDGGRIDAKADESTTDGRFPANVIFDEFTAVQLDEQSGVLTSGASKSSYIQKESVNKSMSGKNYERPMQDRAKDSGGASRFFYCAKASGSERNKGLEDADFEKDIGHNRFDKCKNCGGTILQNADRPSACKCEEPERENNIIKGNHHPTVKPVKLMQYLVRLITPLKGICLDPYNGSGTTGIACKLEGFAYIGIDREEEYCQISQARIGAWENA